jgi:chromosome segregation ATPase
LGGGSPNDLAPALKQWKESVASTGGLGLSESDALPRIPIQIADLAHELWQRANAAAAVELKGGSGARVSAIRTEELESLRSQLSGLRDQLQRESLAFGELRAQAARYEAMAHHALARVDETEARERKHLRDLGTARQRTAELEATINQLRERPATAAQRSPRRRTSVIKTSRAKKAVKARRTKKAGVAKAVRKKAKLAARVGDARRRRVQRRSR